MKLCYTLSLSLLLLLASAPLLKAEIPPAGIFRGYILTHNNMALTGHLGGLGLSGSRVYVQFINDFGTLYQLWPQMIRGFAYEDANGMVLFESWKDKKYWRFLQVLQKGSAMSLYFEPALINDYSILGQKVIETVPLYYIEINGRLERISPTNFRKKLSRIMMQRAPELAGRIGSPGYKFRDLQQIVQSYNDYCKTHPFLL